MPPDQKTLRNQAEGLQPPKLMQQLFEQLARPTFDWSEYRSGVVASMLGTTVHLNPSLYPVNPDRPLVWIHESFHGNYGPGGGFLDVPLAAAAGRPISPELTGEAARDQASRNFQEALKGNCGKPQGKRKKC